MAGNFRVEEANEADFPELAAIVVSSFKTVPVEAAITGPHTPLNIQATAERYLHANRLHQQRYSKMPAIKCVHTDPETGAETIVGTAQWYIYPRKRTAEEAHSPHYLLKCDWMSDKDQKSKVVNYFRPFVDGRVRWMGENAHGVLMYMAVLPQWRRKGIATMCVQWGIDRREELGIAAYLEASDIGVPVYEKLGFKIVESIEYEWGDTKGRCPVMIRLPEHKRSPQRSEEAMV